MELKNQRHPMLCLEGFCTEFPVLEPWPSSRDFWHRATRQLDLGNSPTDQMFQDELVLLSIPLVYPRQTQKRDYSRFPARSASFSARYLWNHQARTLR